MNIMQGGSKWGGWLGNLSKQALVKTVALGSDSVKKNSLKKL